MIDQYALRVAARSRLTADGTLTGLVEGVFGPRVPSTVTWVKPVISLGVQAVARDSLGYGLEAADIRLRLMVFAKGAGAGVGAFSPLYAVLSRADVVLLSSALSVSGHQLVQFEWNSGIPEADPVDENGVPRLQVGSLYKVKVTKP